MGGPSHEKVDEDLKKFKAELMERARPGIALTHERILPPQNVRNGIRPRGHYNPYFRGGPSRNRQGGNNGRAQ